MPDRHDEPTDAPQLTTRSPESAVEPDSEELVLEDLLVEEVSIDGMCGVY